MHLAAGRTLDRIHLLDWGRLKGLRIHREPGVDHFPGRRTLDQYAVHTFLAEQYVSQTGRLSDCKEGSAVTRNCDLRLGTTLRPADRANGLCRYLTHLTCTFTAIICGVGDIWFDTTK